MFHESIYMTRMRVITSVISICTAAAAVYGGAPDESLESSSETANRPFLSQSGAGGVCRGIYRVASAPFIVPLSCLYGLTVPFQSDPEQNGATNMMLYTTAQTIAAPAYVGINTLVGSCACAVDASKGVIEILSLGYYGRQTADNKEQYDSRPYFIQLATRILHGRNKTVGISLIFPKEEEEE